jgi:hypothetical protein
VTATVKSINNEASKFDFVCTSEACFKIKAKLNSTAFGRSMNTPKI